jgi:hypothetical protein
MVVGMTGASRLLAGVYSSDMLVGTWGLGRKVARRGVLRSLSSRQSRADFRAACGAVLLLVMRMMSLGEGEGEGILVVIPPCETPISRLSDVVPPYTASRPVESLASRVKLPKPRPLRVTSNTSDPPLGPGMT